MKSSSYIPRSIWAALTGACFASASLVCTAPAKEPTTLVPAAPEPTSIWEGFYIELTGGGNGLTNDSFHQEGRSGSADYAFGWLAGASVGRQWENLGIEVEWLYRSNDIDSLKLADGGRGDGDLASTSLFLNLTWTFDGWGAAGARWRPYLGLGAGLLEEVDVDAVTAGLEDYSDEWVPAGQVTVGLMRELSPHWAVFAEGRYLYAGEVDLSAESGGGRDVSLNYETWSALVGLRFNF
jgi:hypothetical protein